jgi:hypothetical protein
MCPAVTFIGVETLGAEGQTNQSDWSAGWDDRAVESDDPAGRA